MHDKYIIMHNRAGNFLCQAEKIFRIKRFSKTSIERILSGKPGGRDREEVCSMLHLPSVAHKPFPEIPILFFSFQLYSSGSKFICFIQLGV